MEIESGLFLHSNYLDIDQQHRLSESIRAVVQKAPLFTPTMPKTGKPFTVKMSNCGPLGWVSDKDGYRYQTTHPVTASAWPPIPEILLQLWNDLADTPLKPQACLINHYHPTAKMGLHQDKDEEVFTTPVVSVSLGDDCLFRIGGTKRGGPTRSFHLRSGDVLVMGGASRMAYHGVDRIFPGTSTLLRAPGRINLTLRRVTKPDPAI